jgi:hypothetical protein
LFRRADQPVRYTRCRQLGDNLLALIMAYKYKGIPPELVRKITRQVCIALDFLHRKCRLIHTDLKPENVLLTGNLPPVPLRPAELEGAEEVEVDLTPAELAAAYERDRLLARKMGVPPPPPPRPAGAAAAAAGGGNDDDDDDDGAGGLDADQMHPADAALSSLLDEFIEEREAGRVYGGTSAGGRRKGASVASRATPRWGPVGRCAACLDTARRAQFVCRP